MPLEKRPLYISHNNLIENFLSKNRLENCKLGKTMMCGINPCKAIGFYIDQEVVQVGNLNCTASKVHPHGAQFPNSAAPGV